ncbi:cytochrome b [Tenacibaculum agarivorans]|uniref:cytochrome b n=1 Tax=Tenacibaculum agarivorans TaxID=1908389 RepID=UPI00094B83AC|nr:cytochrome b/b6 domain-containing protein [Tenacibaculum agarivorans]
MKTNNNLEIKYSKGTIVIHWISSILILLLFPMGKYMSDLDPVDKFSLIKIHAILGFIVFIATIIRSIIFFKYKRPEDLKTGSKLNDRLTIWIHNSFYFLLLIISLSGIASMINGGYIDAFKQNSVELIKSPEMILPLKSHDLFATIMMILLILHVIGVIKHYILTKENTLKRIS